jgi:hypothetical protein
MAGLALAAQGAQGLVVASLGPLSDAQERSAKDRCPLLNAKGISITESLEMVNPTGEGEVRTVRLAFWRPQFAMEGYPQVEQPRTPAEGELVVTDRSVTFVPPPGATSVRIPYELVHDVEVRASSSKDAPSSAIVKSCFGRFDIIAFRPADALDSGTAKDAAVHLKARVTAFRTAADN